MVNISKSFHRLQPFKVLVLGDFLLDTYTTGKVRRISPEAPVPVMEVHRHEERPGGAGNVVLNLRSLGGHVHCVGRIGADSYGLRLKELLSQEGIDHDSLVVEHGYITPVKNRLIADSQQLMRIDSEIISPLNSSLEDLLIERLQILIPQMQVVALSDYGKGFLTNRMIRAALDIAACAKIPTIVDPKGTDFTKYKGATVLKPNLGEAYAAVKRPLSYDLSAVAAEIFEGTSVDLLLITRSEAGMSLFDAKGKRKDFPVISKEVIDVTGAGDTVLSVLSLALANALDMPNAVFLSNVAAGIAIERLGCVQVTLSELAERLLKTDNQTKIFDESQSYALQQVLKGKEYSLLVLTPENAKSLKFFNAIRHLAKKETQEMIVYVCDVSPDDDFVQVLSSLHEIDTIILQAKSLKHLCETISPKEVYLLDGDQLIQKDLAKEILFSLINNRAAKA
jgi:D-glycero-beta-D-manno-heptose-7-phosphate kinase